MAIFTLKLHSSGNNTIEQLMGEAYRIANKFDVDVEFVCDSIPVIVRNSLLSWQHTLSDFKEKKAKLEFIAEQGEYAEGKIS